MQENLGYAISAEIPCVIISVQRVGPSTGVPTSPSQGDVMQSRWGTHGDHPIIVICPSSVKECYELAIRAFNLSERYRSPVILLMDEIVAHMREKVVLPPSESLEVVERARATVPPEWYYPYEGTEGDVPPLVSFGEGYRYHITGLLHDKAGFPTERLDEITSLVERLFRKIEANVDDIVQVEEEGIEDATTVLVAYGGVARSARHALKLSRKRGIPVGMLRLKTLWPFAEASIDQLAKEGKRLLVPEMNRGQILLEVERVVAGRVEARGINRMGGAMIRPEDILEAMEG
jgi:2-oxoglutarate ferredoxin oxidoreductase subunit alpha